MMQDVECRMYDLMIDIQESGSRVVLRQET